MTTIAQNKADTVEQHGKFVRQHRAGKACEKCRARKVRCDVTIRGSPCRNCESDGTPCVIAGCRRGRKKEEWYLGTRTRFHDCAPSYRRAINDSFDYGSGKGVFTSPAVDRDNLQNRGVPPSTDLSPSAISVLNSMNSLGDVPSSLDRLHPSPTSLNHAPEEASAEELPDCFQPIPSHLKDADIDYIRTKGGLNIPHEGLRNEIIRCYFEYIHPFLPLLNSTQLLRVVDPSIDSADPKISLLLFQSVMFAAVPFVDAALVRHAAYPSLKAARRGFFEKCKLLYDLDFECDSITLIQSLLLMSFWSDRQRHEAHKQTWHWISIAVALAQTAGLNHNPDLLPLPQRTKRFRKRLWWCCFLRDRVVSLYMSRPMRVRDEEFNVPLPTVEDLEIDSPFISLSSHGCLHRSLPHLSSYDRMTQTELAEIFISFLKLCIVIGSILSAQYGTFRPPSETQEGGEGSILTAMIFPVDSPTSSLTALNQVESTISHLESKLNEWYESLPRSAYWQSQSEPRPHKPTISLREDLHRTRDGEIPSSDSSRPSSVVIQCAILHMCYYTAISALHRSRSRWQQSPHSHEQVSNSAFNIAEISAFLNARGLARYLPVTAITMLVPSIITNALLVKSRSQTSRLDPDNPIEDDETVKARDNVNSLLICLKTLQEVYVAADWVALLVEAMLSRARIKIVIPQSDNLRFGANHGPMPRNFELDVQNGSTDSFTTIEGKHKTPQATVMTGAKGGLSPETTHTSSADVNGTEGSGDVCNGPGSWQNFDSPRDGQVFDNGTDESTWYYRFFLENSDSFGHRNFGGFGIDGFDESADGLIP